MTDCLDRLLSGLFDKLGRDPTKMDGSLEPGPSEARTALKFIAKTLGDLRRRYIQSGLSWGPELESLRLLAASGGQERPDIATDADLSDRLAVDYDDAAKLLSVSSRTVRRLVASGDIPVVKIGTLPRITTADLQAYVETLDRRRTAAHDEEEIRSA